MKDYSLITPKMLAELWYNWEGAFQWAQTGEKKADVGNVLHHLNSMGITTQVELPVQKSYNPIEVLAINAVIQRLNKLVRSRKLLFLGRDYVYYKVKAVYPIGLRLKDINSHAAMAFKIIYNTGYKKEAAVWSFIYLGGTSNNATTI